MTRAGIAVISLGAALLIALNSVIHPLPRLLWNASASVPVGLYAVRRAGRLRVGELVVVTPPEPLARFLAARRYLPEGVPLVKHILALSGAQICRHGRVITVDGAAVGRALDRDRFGRPLPVWQGCRRLAPGEVFLMNRRPPDSLDGRYFGALPATAILGRAEPLWLPSEN